MTAAPAAAAAAATDVPRAVQLVINKLPPGWRHRVTHGAGTVIRKPTDPDTRKQVETVIDVRSAALRLRGPVGEAATAVWLAEWVEDVVTPESVQPEKWVERKATKTMGARCSYVPAKTTPAQLTPAHWRYGFAEAFTWTLCTEPNCRTAPIEHPAGVPQRRNATEFTAWLAPSAPVLELHPSSKPETRKAAAVTDPALDPDVWVPIPMRWRMIRGGDVIVGTGGKLFPVASSTGSPNGEWTLALVGMPHPFTGDPDEVAQVLEQVPMATAMHTARDILGARIVDRRVNEQAEQAA